MNPQMILEAQAVLENRILRGLEVEWELAVKGMKRCYERFGAAMKKPVFYLKDMGVLGQWIRNEQAITVGRNFALSHPWDSLREVLFHEMAHQMVDQVFGGVSSENPHGDNFQRACHFLGTSPRASGNFKTLQECITEGIASDSDRIMARVKKLLALAESSNPHEAEIAMVKAHSLIKEYNLNLLEMRKNSHYFSLFLGNPSIRHAPEEGVMGRLLTDFYFVESIWAMAYVKEKEKIGRALEISGTPENLTIAEYVFHFILRHIDFRWAEYAKSEKLGKSRKSDFALGVIQGFREKLTAEIAGADKSSSRALTVYKDPGLEKYYRLRHPYISQNKGSSRHRDWDIYGDGVEEGKKLIVHRGLTDKGKDPTRLLSHE